VGNAMVSGVSTRVIKLLPFDESSDVVITTLYIDVKNALVRKTSVTTKESGSYEIELGYGKYIDWGLPDKTVFVFNTKDYKLPKGITFEYDKGSNNKKEVPKNKKGRIEIRYSDYIINKGVNDNVFKNK
jgi:outer membrane lipoprotein-sorting protein